ncbi:hypothetical protein [Rathayibacter sp. VKM Ac-2857]|uniref:hypothetical protein n=1 Tax=Rathayibacter sp. VKM Ac-2857 TaxID=2739020 RepID=UPI0015630BF7|nr:hypothetical protein [Rathayibacter sp. VKM Ac-2857]NQX15572.1 hypothetical protein [Rathayibacter sp. VKM Ac-2857]
MSQPSSGTPGPSRRTVTTAAAWSAPVAAAVISAPLAAASTAVPCYSAVNFRRTSNTGGSTAVLQAVSPSGAVSTVRITSVLAPGTTTETQGTSYNLTQAGMGWGGRTTDGAAAEESYSYWGAKALVLNQRRAGPITELPSPGSDAQTLTFQFFDPQGRVFDPIGFELEIVDLTSQERRVWTPTHWDTVGFSVAPTSIAKDGLVDGVGAGTIADPYRRATGEAPTTSFSKTDIFSFDAFPSGSTLTYTQHEGRQGWHAIFLTGLRFRADDC